MSVFEELKRRNVFRVGIAYVVLCWLVAQVGELLFETFGAPEWVLKSLLLVMGLGLPFVLFFAWAFELTPEGLKKESDVDRTQSITPQTGRKLDRVIIAVLVLAVGYFAWDKFLAGPEQPAEPAATADVSAEQPAVPESTLPDDKSIAVLPFENRSRQDSDEFFTSGIHDDLLTQLAQIKSLRVISRTSVAQFKGTTQSIREIAETLQVATILEGGVQRAGNQVRINLQLIDAATDDHLWAQTFDRELTANNIFAIQSEIATAVADAMRATLSPEEQQRIRTVPTENMAALEQYFKGRAELDQRTLPALESARMRFEEARRLDPGFALALAGEAQAILLLADSPTSYGDIPVQEAVRLSEALIQRAYELTPSDPQVLGIYGLLERMRLDFAKADEYLTRSLAINPSSGEVLNWQRMTQYPLGRPERALEIASRMVEVDPMSMIGLYNAVATFINTPYDDTVRISRLLDRLESLDRSYGLSARGLIAWQRGQVLDAARHFYLALEADPGRSSTRSDLAALLFSLGLVDEAMHVDPQRDEYDRARFSRDFEASVRIARARYEEDPEDLGHQISLMYSLGYGLRDAEAAMPLAIALWDRLGENPSAFGALKLDMAMIAQRAEYPNEAKLWRDAGARALQTKLEAGIKGPREYWSQSTLAVLDRRYEAVVPALEEAITLGQRRESMEDGLWPEAVLEDPAFQALVSRMRDTIEEERQAVMEFLCGPDTILENLAPAPETCALYGQSQAAGKSAAL